MSSAKASLLSHPSSGAEKRSAGQARGFVLIALAVLALVLLVLSNSGLLSRFTASVPSAGKWGAMETAERALGSLAPQIGRLNRASHNLSLPDRGSEDVFFDTVTLRPLANAPDAPEPAPVLGDLRVRNWPNGGDEIEIEVSELQIWKPLFERIRYLEHGSFHLSRGRFVDEAQQIFETQSRYDALARLQDGRVMAVRSRQRLRWRRDSSLRSGQDAPWRIAEWRTESMQLTENDSPLFREVLGHVINDPDDLRRARTSIHENLVVRHLTEGKDFKLPHRFFEIVADGSHPGVSVTDIDRDGYDDIFVAARWGRTMLFRNRGNGSFEEIGGELGLIVENHASSAIFADFDNDGDTDALIGRTLARSNYFENDEGRFRDRSSTVAGGELPYFTSSVSAVDYDGDGLLDLYLATYAPALGSLTPKTLRHGPPGTRLFDQYLGVEVADQLYDLVRGEDFHLALNRPGPPNFLLHNVGDGRFEIVADTPLRIFRNTFQASWTDYDGDGDADVYLANDFAPNNLFRNEGNGVFRDVTDETRTADVGFGMGVAWGDYDEDGRHDLYVTNMHSNAGMRIMEQIGDELDSRFPRTAEGNTLFRNVEPVFDEVSGSEPPALIVENAGWSWGGQFVDFNNDGYLDIYALSGYFTSPIEPEIVTDL